MARGEWNVWIQIPLFVADLELILEEARGSGHPVPSDVESRPGAVGEVLQEFV